MARGELKLDGSTGSVELVRALIDKLERRPLLARVLFGRGDLDQLKRHEHRLKYMAAVEGAEELMKKPDPRPLPIAEGLAKPARPRPTTVALKDHPLLTRPVHMKVKARRKAPVVALVRGVQARLYTSTPGLKLVSMIDSRRSISSTTSTSSPSDAT